MGEEETADEVMKALWLLFDYHGSEGMLGMSNQRGKSVDSSYQLYFDGERDIYGR